MSKIEKKDPFYIYWSRGCSYIYVIQINTKDLIKIEKKVLLKIVYK